MAAKITIIIFIALCLEAGVFLTLLPWVSGFGFGDWGDNYLLVYAADKANMPVLRQAVASGWVRGAVSALGILNILLAFWEIAHFNSAVRAVEGKTDVRQAKNAARLPDNRGQSESR